jgi:hypothetical protein
MPVEIGATQGGLNQTRAAALDTPRHESYPFPASAPPRLVLNRPDRCRRPCRPSKNDHADKRAFHDTPFKIPDLSMDKAMSRHCPLFKIKITAAANSAQQHQLLIKIALIPLNK